MVYWIKYPIPDIPSGEAPQLRRFSFALFRLIHCQFPPMPFGSLLFSFFPGDSISPQILPSLRLLAFSFFYMLLFVHKSFFEKRYKLAKISIYLWDRLAYILLLSCLSLLFCFFISVKVCTLYETPLGLSCLSLTSGICFYSSGRIFHFPFSISPEEEWGGWYERGIMPENHAKMTSRSEKSPKNCIFSSKSLVNSKKSSTFAAAFVRTQAFK